MTRLRMTSGISELLKLKQNDLNILERYKKLCRYEGNSNTASPNGYPITLTTYPNTEDINEDITLGTIESYWPIQEPR